MQSKKLVFPLFFRKSIVVKMCKKIELHLIMKREGKKWSLLLSERICGSSDLALKTQTHIYSFLTVLNISTHANEFSGV